MLVHFFSAKLNVSKLIQIAQLNVNKKYGLYVLVKFFLIVNLCFITYDLIKRFNANIGIMIVLCERFETKLAISVVTFKSVSYINLTGFSL